MFLASSGLLYYVSFLFLFALLSFQLNILNKTQIKQIETIVRHACYNLEKKKCKYLFALPSQCHGSKTCENSNQVEWLRFPAHPSGCLNVVEQSKEQHQWMIRKTIFIENNFRFTFIFVLIYMRVIEHINESFVNVYCKNVSEARLGIIFTKNLVCE